MGCSSSVWICARKLDPKDVFLVTSTGRLTRSVPWRAAVYQRIVNVETPALLPLYDDAPTPKKKEWLRIAVPPTTLRPTINVALGRGSDS